MFEKLWLLDAFCTLTQSAWSIDWSSRSSSLLSSSVLFLPFSWKSCSAELIIRFALSGPRVDLLLPIVATCSAVLLIWGLRAGHWDTGSWIDPPLCAPILCPWSQLAGLTAASDFAFALIFRPSSSRVLSCELALGSYQSIWFAGLGAPRFPCSGTRTMRGQFSSTLSSWLSSAIPLQLFEPGWLRSLARWKILMFSYSLESSTLLYCLIDWISSG